MHADTSLWLELVTSPQSDLFFIHTTQGTQKSSESGFEHQCKDSFSRFVFQILFLFVNTDKTHRFLSCECMTMSILTVSFMCVKRKWWPRVTACSLPFFKKNFFFYPNPIQLLPDKYLRPLHLRGLQQSGAEAHPSAPHAGEPPQHLHFCKWRRASCGFCLLFNDCVWDCVTCDLLPTIYESELHGEFQKSCNSVTSSHY